MPDINNVIAVLHPLVVPLARASSNTLVSLVLGLAYVSKHDLNTFEALIELNFPAIENFCLVAGQIQTTEAKQALSRFLDRHASIHSLELISMETEFFIQPYSENSWLFDPSLITSTSLAGLRSLKTDCTHLMALLKAEVESVHNLKRLALEDKHDTLPDFVMQSFGRYRLPSVMHLTCAFAGAGTPKLAARMGQMCFNTQTYELMFLGRFTHVRPVGPFPSWDNIA